jgi:ADP-ribosylation factor GTPase-activating protein 1
MDIKEKYNSWAATQYKEKVRSDRWQPGSTYTLLTPSVAPPQLAAECSDPPVPWAPSAAPPASLAPPASASTNSSRPTSAQGVRGSRGAYGGGGISSSDYQSGSSSPSGYGNGGYSDEPQDERSAQKAANENFFAGMGNKNASRREDLPPSQGASL